MQQTVDSGRAAGQFAQLSSENQAHHCSVAHLLLSHSRPMRSFLCFRICGAIFDAAGLGKLSKACDAILDHSGRVPPGQTRLTRGMNLHAPFILHTVGPMDRDEHGLLDAYKATLDACVNPALLDQREDEDIRIQSVAMCCIRSVAANACFAIVEASC